MPADDRKHPKEVIEPDPSIPVRDLSVREVVDAASANQVKGGSIDANSKSSPSKIVADRA